jgi:hypothetical protein
MSGGLPLYEKFPFHELHHPAVYIIGSSSTNVEQILYFYYLYVYFYANTNIKHEGSALKGGESYICLSVIDSVNLREALSNNTNNNTE